MELLSVGSGVKMIRGVSSGRYLAMNRSGVVYSTQIAGNETMFLERMESNGYSTFASLKFYRRVFYDTLVAVRNNGKMRPGTKTNRLHKSAQFLVLTALKCQV
ncbi:hypothetical protein QZH41_013401 [Actinostola sp. cb2023]|nr:hypothetical protein QZH41_013401 [Actinostola sp. cb2023]